MMLWVSVVAEVGGGVVPRMEEDPARNAEGDRDVTLETQTYPVRHLAMNLFLAPKPWLTSTVK